MGSGKTHWGKLVADEMKMPFFDLDKVITDKEQKTVTEIFAENGEEYFRVKEREVLESLTAEHERFILSCGGGTPCFFNNISFMKKQGKVVWLNTQVDVLVSRLLKEKNTRPLIRDIPSSELKGFIMKKLLSRKLYYQQADLTVHEESLSLNHFMKMITDA